MYFWFPFGCLVQAVIHLTQPFLAHGERFFIVLSTGEVPTYIPRFSPHFPLSRSESDVFTVFSWIALDAGYVVAVEREQVTFPYL